HLEQAGRARPHAGRAQGLRAAPGLKPARGGSGGLSRRTPPGGAVRCGWRHSPRLRMELAAALGAGFPRHVGETGSLVPPASALGRHVRIPFNRGPFPVFGCAYAKNPVTIRGSHRKYAVESAPETPE